MFDPLIDVNWPAGLLWLAGISVAAFLVSWILSDIRPTKRVLSALGMMLKIRWDDDSESSSSLVQGR